MLGLRLAVLLLLGSTLFSDEQERFVCNTIQPGCSAVCFDLFAPVSVLRLWLFHLILLALPHLLFATYVMHQVLAPAGSGGSPRGLEGPSLHQSQLQEPGGPRFHCAYVLVVLVRILLEAVFGAGQFQLFGLSFPRSFLCYQAPCTSGVECYISRRTEKSLMLAFMLGVASLSILLSLFDLLSSVKAMVGRRRRRGELIKGEQSSVITATTTAEDGDKSSGWSRRDAQVEPPPTPTSTPGPSRLGLHSRAGAGQYAPARTKSGQQSDSSDGPDRRAWV